MMNFSFEAYLEYGLIGTILYKFEVYMVICNKKMNYHLIIEILRRILWSMTSLIYTE